MSKPGRVIGPEEESLSFNGSTANGILTYGGANQIDVESDLTFSSNNLGNVGGNLNVIAGSSLSLFGSSVSITSGHLNINGTNSSAAYINLHEDTDNGTNAVKLLGPASTSGQTITLPDATGTAVIDTKVLVTHSIAYFANTTSDYVIPLAGTSHSDNTNLSLYIFQYFSNFAAPYNGQFKKMMFCTSSTAARDIDVKFYKNGQISTQTGTTANYTTSGARFGSISPTDWTFTAGERLGIVIDPQSGNQGGHVSATIVFEFDTTT